MSPFDPMNTAQTDTGGADVSSDVPARVTIDGPPEVAADPVAPQPPEELRKRMPGYQALRAAQAPQAPAQSPAPSEASDPAPAANPAALRGSVEISLQTKAAQDLAAGRARMAGERRSTPVIGLMTFAKQVRWLHQAARIDDPYATWFLLRITRECEVVKAELATRLGEVQNLMSMPGLAVTVGQTPVVFTVPLTFSTPHAFRGAYLLLELDRYVRLLLTAEHIAVIDRTGKYERLHEATRLVRSVFAIPGQYVYLELTREDVRNGTARAAQARQRMGELPAEVLDGPTLDPFAPDPRRGPNPEVAGKISDNLQDAFAKRNERWSARQAARAVATDAGSGSDGE